MSSNDPQIPRDAGAGPDTAASFAQLRRWRRRRLLKAPLILALAALVLAGVRLLWNSLIPELFHGPELNYGQTVGLFVLSKVFLGFGGGRRFGHHRHQALHDRWHKLAPDERERLRGKLRDFAEPASR